MIPPWNQTKTEKDTTENSSFFQGLMLNECRIKTENIWDDYFHGLLQGDHVDWPTQGFLSNEVYQASPLMDSPAVNNDLIDW